MSNFKIDNKSTGAKSRIYCNSMLLIHVFDLKGAYHSRESFFTFSRHLRFPFRMSTVEEMKEKEDSSSSESDEDSSGMIYFSMLKLWYELIKSKYFCYVPSRINMSYLSLLYFTYV